MTENNISKLEQDSQKKNIIMYIVLLLSVIVSFLIMNILVFIITFLVLLLVDTILKMKSKPIKRESVEKEEPTPEIKEFNQFKKKARKTGIFFSGIVIVAFLLAQFMDEAMYVVIVSVIIAFIYAITIQKQENEKYSTLNVQRYDSNRLEWVDQFRGMVVVFLIIAAITWELSGGRENGLPISDLPPVGPTFLNHGWKYAEPSGWPQMITLIDIGQQILMFIMGFVGALAYYRHRDKEGELGAILHIMRRFMALMILAMVVEGELFDGNFDLTQWSVSSVFWTSTFPNLAWGSFIGLLLVAALKKQPDKRMYIAISIMVIHTILYSIPELQSWRLTVGPEDHLKTFFEVPWNTINHVSIAIMGTCTYDWYMMKTEEDPELGWKKRIVPIGTLCFIGVWLVNFIQSADHRDATTALSLMAIATSMLVLFVYYEFDRIDYHMPGLTVFGKNILIMFLLTGVWGTYSGWFDKAMLVANPWASLVLIGVIPIILQWMFAWSLARFRIIIKF